MLRVLVHNWWLLALRGCFALVFAIAAFIIAGAHSLWLLNSFNSALLTVLFGLFALGAGVFTVIAGVRSYGKDRGWLLLFLDGVAACVAGILVIVLPNLTLVHLIQIIAVWALIVAGCELWIAAKLWRHLPDAHFVIFGAAGSLIFGYYLLSHGVATIESALIWLGLYSLFSGSMMLAFAVRLRALSMLPHNQLEHLQTAPR